MNDQAEHLEPDQRAQVARQARRVVVRSIGWAAALTIFAVVAPMVVG